MRSSNPILHFVSDTQIVNRRNSFKETNAEYPYIRTTVQTTMEAFRTTLETNATESYQRRQEQRHDEQRQRDEAMKQTIDELYNDIVLHAKETMIDASLQGKFSCVLFECGNSDVYKESTFKTVFLLKGPLRWSGPKSFFEAKGIDSPVTKLCNHFAPIDIFCRYDRVARKHLIEAAWKTVQREGT